MLGNLKSKIRQSIADAFQFAAFRILFPGVYCLHAKRPVQEDKVLFIEVHEPEMTDNFRLLYQNIKRSGRFHIHVHFLRNGFVGRMEYIRRCTAMLKDLAAAKYVFLNTGSNVIGCIPMRKETILTQTWHACGAFKKFGYSTAKLKYGATAEQIQKYPYYANTTYVTLSSPQTAWAYEEAMMLSGHRECLKPVGISRTDVFFKQKYIEAAKAHVLQCVPAAKNKKIILYAPTFRGRITHAEAPDRLDLPALMHALEKDYVLIIKHHPYIQHLPEIPAECAGFAADVTKKLSIEELLCASDICISDYSSLVFEYSLFERPMIFFAYDLEDYFDWRGFYYDYHELAPGPVVRTNEEIIEQIRHMQERFDRRRVRQFREKFMSSCDGHATERILKMVFGDALLS